MPSLISPDPVPCYLHEDVDLTPMVRGKVERLPSTTTSYARKPDSKPFTTTVTCPGVKPDYEEHVVEVRGRYQP